jgi:hypothetical protein
MHPRDLIVRMPISTRPWWMMAGYAVLGTFLGAMSVMDAVTDLHLDPVVAFIVLFGPWFCVLGLYVEWRTRNPFWMVGTGRRMSVREVAAWITDDTTMEVDTKGVGYGVVVWLSQPNRQIGSTTVRGEQCGCLIPWSVWEQMRTDTILPAHG